MFRRRWLLLAVQRRLPPLGRGGVMLKATPQIDAARHHHHNNNNMDINVNGSNFVSPNFASDLAAEWPNVVEVADAWEEIPEHTSGVVHDGVGRSDVRGVDESTQDGYTAVEEEVGHVEEDAEVRSDESSLTTTNTSPLVGTREDDGTTSSGAYQSLLDHIDAEIAAIRQRHINVVERRSNMEGDGDVARQVFDFLERPWTFLPTDVPPALPATGAEVFIKEQQLRHQQQHQQAHNHTGQEGSEAQSSPRRADTDRLHLLAWHKNYNNLRADQRRPYDVAAAENERLRGELRRRLCAGCTSVELFLADIVECTADRVRSGEYVASTQRAPTPSPTHAPRRMMAAKTDPSRPPANTTISNKNVRPALLVSPGGGFSVSAAAREAKEARRRLAVSRVGATNTTPHEDDGAAAVGEEAAVALAPRRRRGDATTRNNTSSVPKTPRNTKPLKNSTTKASKKTSIRSTSLPRVAKVERRHRRNLPKTKASTRQRSSTTTTTSRAAASQRGRATKPTTTISAKVKASKTKRAAKGGKRR